jgi:hypothetical protein
MRKSRRFPAFATCQECRSIRILDGMKSSHRISSLPVSLALASLVGLLAIGAAKGPSPASSGATKKPAAAPEQTVLRIMNGTPFIVQIFVEGVRVGWLRPFRTELFRGLKPGKHKVFASSEYATTHVGPVAVDVPGAWNVSLGAEEWTPDLVTALAARIFKANKSSILACDRLAERRGESLGDLRVEFAIEVNADGRGTAVRVTGSGLSEPLRSCYRSMVAGWQYPKTGAAYQATFEHVH